MDGGASPETHRSVVRHLQLCLPCRERLRAIDQTTAMGRKYDALSDEAGATRSVRFRRQLQATRHSELRRQDQRRRMVGTAAVMAIGIAGLLLLRPPSLAVVDMDDVLIRAAETEQAAPAARRRVRLMMTPRVGPLASGPPVAALWVVRYVDNGRLEAKSDVALAGLANGLTRAGVDPEQLLRVSAFGNWRTGVQQRRDRVTLTGDLLVLQTAAPSGPIQLGELRVSRSASYRVIGQAWVIAGLGRFDIQALPEPESLAATEAEPTRVEAAGTAGDGRRPVSSVEAIEHDALDRLELDVRLAVSAADPDGPVDIVQRESRVVVTGALASATKRRALAARLTLWPGVDVRLGADTRSAGGRRGADLARWGERVFGQGPARHTFANQLRGAALTVDRRRDGLEALARRYPVDAARALSPEARAKLQLLVTREYRALTADLLALDGRLMVLGSSAASLALPRADPPSDWRSRVIQAASGTAALQAEIDALLFSEDDPDATATRTAFNRIWGVVAVQR